jgi:hypothetical protein
MIVSSPYDGCRDGKCPLPDGVYHDVEAGKVTASGFWTAASRITVHFDVDGYSFDVVKTAAIPQGQWDTMLAFGLRPAVEKAEMQREWNKLARCKGKHVTLNVVNGKAFINAPAKRA